MQTKNKPKQSEVESDSIVVKSVPIDDRLTIRLSSPVKSAFVALQKHKNYSYNGMIMAYLDSYTKRDEESSDKLVRYCEATIDDDSLVTDIKQMFNDFKDSNIPNVSELSLKIDSLTLEVDSLRSQIQFILNQYPNVANEVTAITRSNASTIKAIEVVPKKNHPSLCESKYVSLSLNSIIEAKLKNAAPSWFKEFTYSNFVYNYTELNLDLKNVQDEIKNYIKELTKLLRKYCENDEMCETFHPANLDILTRYIDVRTAKSGRISNLKDVWDLTLREIEEVIIELGQYEATDKFTVSSATMNSPQSVMKTVLRNQYGMIFKESSTFKTF